MSYKQFYPLVTSTGYQQEKQQEKQQEARVHLQGLSTRSRPTPRIWRGEPLDDGEEVLVYLSFAPFLAL